MHLARTRVVVHAVRAIARSQLAEKRRAKHAGGAAGEGGPLPRGAGVRLQELEAAYPLVRDVKGLLTQSGLVPRPGTGSSSSNPLVFDLPEGQQAMQVRCKWEERGGGAAGDAGALQTGGEGWVRGRGSRRCR